MRRLWRGIKYHSGTEWLIGFTIMGGIAGYFGPLGWPIGAGVMFVIFGIPYFISAWKIGERSDG